jgi:hypothetical protein
MPDVVPGPVAAPARPTPPQIRRRRRVALLGAGGLALVVAAVAAVLVGGGGGGSGGTSGNPPAAAGTYSLHNADLALAAPKSWAEGAADPKVPGLHRRRAVTASPGGGSYVTAELVAGKADPTLLPPKLLGRLKGRPAKSKTTFGGLEAYRYDRLRPRGSSKLLRVYTVLTNAGVATVACSTPPGGGATLAACDKLARTLRLISAEGLPLGPSKDYGAMLNEMFATLNARIDAANIRIAKAPNVTAQATALRQSAGVFQSAVDTLHGRKLNPIDTGLNAKLESVLATFVSAYRQLERAVQSNDPVAKAKAQQALKRALRRIRAATTTLQRVGYTDVPTIATPRTAVKPPAPAAKAPVTPQSTPQPAPAPAPAPAPQPAPKPKPSSPNSGSGSGSGGGGGGGGGGG